MAIKCFYKWLFSDIPNDNVLKNPEENIRSINKIERLPKYLDLEQARQVQKVFNIKNSKNPMKNNMIICLFLASGIRVSELISIKIKDINFNNNTIQILGKGNKQRTTYFNEYCKKELLKYINARYNNGISIDLDNYLFLNYKNEKYTR